MSRFSFSQCGECGRINIHGATCTCGNNTYSDNRTHELPSPDALTSPEDSGSESLGKPRWTYRILYSS